MIESRDLAVGYGEKTVLAALNIQIQAGQFISLLGPNGAGKTTLLKTLARLLSPRQGTIFLDGKALQFFRQEELARVLAVVLTEQVSPGLFSAFEFVSLGRYPHTGFLGTLQKRDRQAIQTSFSLVHAEDLAPRQLNTLSDGERQKVFVARALAQDPRVILLDEPTLHLDLKHRMEVMSILQRLCREKGITVVASLHDVDIAAKISDQVALVKNGAIIAWGPPEEVLQEETVSALYDFQGASFNQRLGSIEFRSNGNKGSVFVVAGMASGVILYRLLSKRGFSIVTGILPANDLDYYVARSLGAECIVEAPMTEISPQAFEQASKLLAAADGVIDAGFPVGNLNRKNLRLLDLAQEQGKPLFTLRTDIDAPGFRPSADDQRIRCQTEMHLLEKLGSSLKER